MLYMILLLSILCGCDKSKSDPSNIFDPSNPNYEQPTIEIKEGPSDNTTIYQSKVSFKWIGKYSDVDYKYSYQLDNSGWSAWEKLLVKDFDELYEGKHIFSVKCKYLDNSAYQYREEGPAQTRTFFVDAVKGPSLMIKPRSTKADKDKTFQIQLMAEEVRDLVVAHLLLEFDDSMIQIANVPEKGNFLASNGGTVAFFRDPPSQNTIGISTGVSIGNPVSVNGSGVMANILFKAVRIGKAEIKYKKESLMRDSNNRAITLNSEIGCIVDIQ